MNQVNQATYDQVQELFAEAISKKLSNEEFAGKIWLGAIYGSVPELTIALSMFEKGSTIRQPETDELLQNLINLTFCGDSEAVQRALSLICDGLNANNETKNT